MTFERNTKRSMSDQMYSQLSIRLGLTQNEMFLDSVAIKQSKFLAVQDSSIGDIVSQ